MVCDITFASDVKNRQRCGSFGHCRLCTKSTAWWNILKRSTIEDECTVVSLIILNYWYKEHRLVQHVSNPYEPWWYMSYFILLDSIRHPFWSSCMCSCKPSSCMLQEPWFHLEQFGFFPTNPVRTFVQTTMVDHAYFGPYWSYNRFRLRTLW